MAPRHRIPAGTALAASALLLAGCAGAGRTGEFATTLRVWPVPPALPRVALVGEIRDPSEYGTRPSAWDRVVNTLAGSARGREAFVQPQGLSVDETGNLCVADPGSGAVVCLDRSRGRRMRWEGVDGRPFQMPVAVARRDGIMYVADAGWGQVVAFDGDGRQRFVSGEELRQPAGLALATNSLWVADAGRHALFQYSLDGRLLATVGRRGEGPGEFNFPTHLCCGPEGRLYVTDSMNCRIQILDAQGGCLGSVGRKGGGMGQFNRPKGVAVDRHARIFVVDALFDNVQIFDDADRLLLYFGEAGQGPGEFWLPSGAAFDGDRLYVADTYNHRIQVFKNLDVP